MTHDSAVVPLSAHFESVVRSRLAVGGRSEIVAIGCGIRMGALHGLVIVDRYEFCLCRAVVSLTAIDLQHARVLGLTLDSLHVSRF